MSSSSPTSPLSSSNPLSLGNSEEEPETRNWLELPRDVTSTILMKLGAIEILNSAQLVCTLWRSICKEPVMWRTIDMRNFEEPKAMGSLEMMCRHAIDRSCGQLVDINVEYFGTDDLLNYIADSPTCRACHLRRLRVLQCDNITHEAWCEVAKELHWLEELDISICHVSKVTLEAIGRNCSLLKSLKFNLEAFRSPLIEYDDDALEIAQTMPELRHLQLFGNKLTNAGLLAILDGCPHLESLDLRGCFNVDLGGSLGRSCAEQIKDLRHPDAPTGDYAVEINYNLYDDYCDYDEDYRRYFRYLAELYLDRE